MPLRTAWAVCGRSECGTTTKVWVRAVVTPVSCQPASVLTRVPSSTGLSPAWFLQHIIVRDLQSARSTFFLVNDWLSVETEANGGLVEKEVLAASKAALCGGDRDREEGVMETGRREVMMVDGCPGILAATILNLPR